MAARPSTGRRSRSLPRTTPVRARHDDFRCPTETADGHGAGMSARRFGIADGANLVGAGTVVASPTNIHRRAFMECWKIEGTNLAPSRVGLVTWAIGGWSWGGSDDERSFRTITAGER